MKFLLVTAQRLHTLLSNKCFNCYTVTYRVHCITRCNAVNMNNNT